MFGKKPKAPSLTPEEREIIDSLKRLQREIDAINNNLNFITDPTLIDSYIYQMKAVKIRYQYYLNQCKERELRLGLDFQA